MNTMIQVEQKDSSEVASENEERELVESEEIGVRQSTHGKKAPAWHSNYIMKSNIAYYF